ncbi:MAG: S8 family serine peptidase, partial [Acidobacteria bacterium]|nr:S8 family serine peptidase [Acidobacteriota bacterium]
MKKYFWVIIMFFLGIIVINFAGNVNGGDSPNINKKAGANNDTIFKIPTAQAKTYDRQSIIVKFKPGASRIQRNKLAGLVSGKFKDRNNDGIDDRYSSIMGGNLALLKLDGEKKVDLAAPALAVLKNHPNIEYAEYNYRQYITVSPGDPLFSSQWGMNNTGQTGGVPDADIDAPEAWDIAMGSSEVIVGVIDTGVDYTHEDLAVNSWINPNEIPGNGLDDDGNGYIDDIHGINSIIENGDPMDDHFHGTHCSGIIGAAGNNSIGVAGVNWIVKIVGMKFLDSGGYGWTADAIECINYAVWLKNHGVNIRVLSNSWGNYAYEQSLVDAISDATNAGILFTAAAGNDINDNDVYPFYPASYPNVLAVASTDCNDGLSYFSNYGANTVHLGAPGSDILSTVLHNGYETHSGTSMATPHVSGAAALLLSINDQLTVQEIKDYLMDYGDPIPALDGITVSGKRLNLYNSLDQVPPPGPTFRLSASPVSQVIEQGQSVSYTINIQSVLGYSTPVTLSAASTPPIDATISFSPNPAVPGATSLMTVATTNAVAATDYMITITGSDGSIVKTTSVLLEVVPMGTVTVSYTNDTVIPIPDCYPGITGVIDIPDPLKIWEMAVTVNITHTCIWDL